METFSCFAAFPTEIRLFMGLFKSMHRVPYLCKSMQVPTFRLKTLAPQALNYCIRIFWIQFGTEFTLDNLKNKTNYVNLGLPYQSFSGPSPKLFNLLLDLKLSILELIKTRHKDLHRQHILPKL